MKKVLLVEDDAFTRFMMKEIIGTLEVDVSVVCNGEEGYLLLQQAPEAFGLVLMDMHMPKVSGVEATRLIRQLNLDPPRNIPIIAVTADVDYQDEGVVEAHGMNGFVSKPVSPGELLQLIERYCSAP